MKKWGATNIVCPLTGKSDLRWNYIDTVLSPLRGWFRHHVRPNRGPHKKGGPLTGKSEGARAPLPAWFRGLCIYMYHVRFPWPRPWRGRDLPLTSPSCSLSLLTADAHRSVSSRPVYLQWQRVIEISTQASVVEQDSEEEEYLFAKLIHITRYTIGPHTEGGLREQQTLINAGRLCDSAKTRSNAVNNQRLILPYKEKLLRPITQQIL